MPRSLHALLILIFALTASRPSFAANKRITLRLSAEPATLDWNISARRIDQLIINNLHEGLIEIGINRKPLPDLATSWTISPDGMSYTFFLRTDATWSDGKPLTAQDFVDSWKRLITPLTATGNGYFLLDVTGAEDYFRGRQTDFSQVGIKALNSTTIRIKLRKPMWNWVGNFAQPATFPIRQDLIDKHGAKFWTAPGNLVTAGPFVLDSHDLNSSYVLKRNPHYKGPRGNVTEVDYKILSDAETISAFERGKVDLVCHYSGEVPASLKPYLKWSVANITKRIDFNVRRFPLNSKSARRAIALALNRTAMAAAFEAGMSPATSTAPPSMSTHVDSSALKFDPVEARKLLQKAGVEHLSLEVLVPMFDEHAAKNLKLAEIIRTMLQQNLHASVTIQKAETEQLYSLLRDTQDYSLLIRDWNSPTDDPDEFYSFYATETHKSTTWHDPGFDKLIEQTRLEKSPAKRADLYRQIESFLTDELPVLPVLYEADASLVSGRIRGFESQSSHPCVVRDLKLSN